MSERRQCKDCEATIGDDVSLVENGWRWIDLVEGGDVCNGWRCPACAKGWDTIIERTGEALQ